MLIGELVVEKIGTNVVQELVRRDCHVASLARDAPRNDIFYEGGQHKSVEAGFILARFFPAGVKGRG
jgi:hypothetical protein